MLEFLDIFGWVNSWSGGMTVGVEDDSGYDGCVGVGIGDDVGVSVLFRDDDEFISESSDSMICGVLGLVVAVLAMPVLPNPPEPLVVWSRDRSTLNAGEANFSKRSCAIRLPSLILNCFWLEYTSITLTSPCNWGLLLLPQHQYCVLGQVHSSVRSIHTSLVGLLWRSQGLLLFLIVAGWRC